MPNKKVLLQQNYTQYQQQPNGFAKYIYLDQLRINNKHLFYQLLNNHIQEMMPIIYTPTVGEAVQKFSTEFDKSQGLFIAYPDKDRIETILADYPDSDVDIIVVSDGEAVLGIGDQGIGAIHICIGKLSVYTACAAINPYRMLPILLDVGTNNEQLLNDPQYVGWRHKRLAGQEYDDFIDAFVQAVQKRFPHTFLHWEDLACNTARKILERYSNTICTFNDDMQGTGAVVLASLLNAMKILKQKLSEQRIVFFGAGTAATGIADQIREAMIRENLSYEAACEQIYLVDRQGLITANTSNTTKSQRVYAKSSIRAGTLLDVVKEVKPTILVGVSTASGAFNREIVTAMAQHVARPIIFPLSNPTANSEAIPSDLLTWTKGKALIATGSPFAGTTQCNNAFAFPGIGLGVIACKAKRLTDTMIWAGVKALSECTPIADDPNVSLLPQLEDIKQVSRKVAKAVAEQAIAENLADNMNVDQAIESTIWKPGY